MAVGYSGIALAACIHENASELEEHVIEVLQQFGSKMGKCCNVCGKQDGTTKCSACKLIYFCGKECQQKDWNLHKKFCNIVKTFDFCAEPSSTYMDMEPHQVIKLFNTMRDYYFDIADAGTVAPEIPKFHEEYRRICPTDIDNYDSLLYYWTNMSTFDAYHVDRSTKYRYSEKDFRSKLGQYFINRWYMCLKSKEPSSQLPMLEPGDILTDLVLSKVEEIGEPYQVNHSMKNSPVRPQTFQIGQTYVAIGFVDLSPLIMGSFEPDRRSTEPQQPMKYICYDKSPIVVARNKVLYQMMLDNVYIDSILQAWFSTRWSRKTLDDFQQSGAKVNANLDLTAHGSAEVMELLSHWITTILDLRSDPSVLESWTEHVKHLEMETLANLRYEHDRADFAYYFFRGTLFAENESDYLYGNVTMFGLPDSFKGYIRQKESIFFTIAIDFLKYTTSLLESVTSKIKSGLNRLIKHIQDQSVICTFATENFSMRNIQVLEAIKEMNPIAIDWSNIQEYLNLDNFFEMAEACDGTSTTHSLHFMCWTNYVCGTSLIDYPNPLYMARDIAQEQAIQYDKIKSKRPYLRQDEFMAHYLNSATMNLSSKYRQKFIDFVFSGRNIDIEEVYSEVFNPFASSNSTFFVKFNFKK